MSKNLIKFFSEIYILKRIKREGWRLINAQPESVAEHLAIAAQLAYILGELEGLSGEKCAAMVLFHDNGETRILDQHKVAARYINTAKAERNALKDQIKLLPKKIAEKILKLTQDFEKRNTAESIVAKDADWLEVALQAKILIEQGYKFAQNWVDNVSKALETKSAKVILGEIMKEKDFTNCWWRGLKKMTYRKLHR